MKITYDEYDAWCDKMNTLFEKAPTKPYYPTEEDLDIMDQEFDKYKDFLIYLSETNPAGQTSIEKESMKRINSIINSHFEFVD